MASASPTPQPTPLVRPLGWQMLAVVRLVLALVGLLVIAYDRAEPQRLAMLTYASLVAYTLFSAGVVYVTYRRRWLAPYRWLYWADVIFAGYLVGLTEGTFSLFFFFFYFSILGASFTRGFREGLLITAAALLFYVMAAAMATPIEMAADFGHTLVRPLALAALGYVMAYWGGYEIALKQKLAVLAELTGTFNPRDGRERVISSNLERLREFFDADAALLVLHRPAHHPPYFLYRADGRIAEHTDKSRHLADAAAQDLLALGNAHGMYTLRPRRWLDTVHRRGAPARRDRREDEAIRAIAHLLDAEAFITVPFVQGECPPGRLFVAGRGRRFDSADVPFLSQWTAALCTILDNLGLIDELMSSAAELERLTISRDMHDTVVQPYIGLKLALDALSRQVPHDTPFAAPLQEIICMTDMTIADLRAFTFDLKAGALSAGGSLEAALARQAERYKRFYGLEVDLTCDDAAELSGPTATAVFRIVAEALSNIVRHTTAKRAFVHTSLTGASLLIEIGNAPADGAGARPNFLPQSIAERVIEMQGALNVNADANGYTVVEATIPLSPVA